MVRSCYFCENRSVLSYFLTHQKMVTFWTYAGESGTTLNALGRKYDHLCYILKQ